MPNPHVSSPLSLPTVRVWSAVDFPTLPRTLHNTLIIVIIINNYCSESGMRFARARVYFMCDYDNNVYGYYCALVNVTRRTLYIRQETLLHSNCMSPSRVPRRLQHFLPHDITHNTQYHVNTFACDAQPRRHRRAVSAIRPYTPLVVVSSQVLRPTWTRVHACITAIAAWTCVYRARWWVCAGKKGRVSSWLAKNDFTLGDADIRGRGRRTAPVFLCGQNSAGGGRTKCLGPAMALPEEGGAKGPVPSPQLLGEVKSKNWLQAKLCKRFKITRS